MIDLPARAPTLTDHARHGPSGLQLLCGPERRLWEACERALRQPREWLVMVLYLSRLQAPAPRPHHVRVARVLLQDAASQFGGQVFAMGNQDLVLLCTWSRQEQGGARSRAAATRNTTSGNDGEVGQETDPSPRTLPSILGRLFSADVPDAAWLTSVWRLDSQTRALLAYLEDRAANPQPDAAERDEETLPRGGDGLAMLRQTLADAPLPELLVQQTGMSLGSDRALALADRLAPAFREVELSLGGLDLRRRARRALEDPFLLRHLATSLDGRMIQLLGEDLGAKGRLTRTAIASGLPIHLGLGLEAILSPAFARLSRQASTLGLRFGVGVSVMQACADLDLMDHARRVVQLLGGQFILNGVEPAALGLITPALLQPDLLKLVWMPGPAMDSVRDTSRSSGLLGGIDPSQIVLQGVTSQAALAWGQARGITLFQGAFLDQVQAVGRMARCAMAPACTLGQCTGRAHAVAGPARAGCGNPSLLDSHAGPSA